MSASKLCTHVVAIPRLMSLRRCAAGIILQMGYGYQVKDGADPMVQLINRALDGLTAAATPGSFFVDIVPARTRLPAD